MAQVKRRLGESDRVGVVAANTPKRHPQNFANLQCDAVALMVPRIVGYRMRWILLTRLRLPARDLDDRFNSSHGWRGGEVDLTKAMDWKYPLFIRR